VKHTQSPLRVFSAHLTRSTHSDLQQLSRLLALLVTGFTSTKVKFLTLYAFTGFTSTKVQILTLHATGYNLARSTHSDLQQLQRQYLYFCTSEASKLRTSGSCSPQTLRSKASKLRTSGSCSKASKLRTSGACSPQTLRPHRPLQLLRCQYLYFCPSKSSKLSTYQPLYRLLDQRVCGLLRQLRHYGRVIRPRMRQEPLQTLASCAQGVG